MRTRPIVPLLALAALAAAHPAAAHRHRVPVDVHVGWLGGWLGPAWHAGWYGPGWYAPASYGAVPADVAVVDTDVSPEHARVYLDGTLIGTADDFDGYPSYLFLKPGRYTLELKLPGYAPESLNLEAAAGRMFPLDLKLRRVAGERPAAWYDRPPRPEPGAVYAPAQPERREPAGGPDLHLRPELGGAAEEAAAAPPGEAPAGPPAGSLAALVLRVAPASASVWLDGEFVGTAGELSRLERGLAVRPGQHRLEVMAPDHEPRGVTVEVPEGQRQEVVVELEKRGGQTG